MGLRLREPLVLLYRGVSAGPQGGTGRAPGGHTIHLALERAGSLRYGENPHQHGARYRIVGRHSWWDDVVQHGGKELSYLNIFDADAAWRLVHELAGPDTDDDADEGAVEAPLVEAPLPADSALGLSLDLSLESSADLALPARA